MSRISSDWPWSVPFSVETVTAEGQQHYLVTDAATLLAIARFTGVNEITRLEADITTVRRGDGVHVTGHVSAAVGQTCVVTLEPMRREVNEPIDLLYLQSPPDSIRDSRDGEEEPGKVGDERIEALRGGSIDLGVIATEFLTLGIDTHPRKPDAVFASPPADKLASNPFAALAVLKETPGQDGGER